jgi:hypothetical protein
VSDEARSINTSLQSIMQRMPGKFLKESGSDCAVMSLDGNGFSNSSSFSNSIIQVLKIRDRVDTETSNLSDRSCRNNPTYNITYQYIKIQCNVYILHQVIHFKSVDIPRLFIQSMLSNISAVFDHFYVMHG